MIVKHILKIDFMNDFLFQNDKNKYRKIYKAFF